MALEANQFSRIAAIGDDDGSGAEGFDFEPLRTRQLYERVANEIADQIRSGALRSGDRLPSERAMAQQLEVGRSTVREAIASLQLAGLIETRRGAGSVVAQDADVLVHQRAAADPGGRPDASPAALLEARELIEPAVARRAAERGRPDAVAEALLESGPEPIDLRDPAGRVAWNDRDRLFHRQIGVMTGNPIFAAICDDIAETMNEVLWQHLRDSVLTAAGRAGLFEAEHRMIYEAIVEGAADAAEFYSREHIKRVRRYMALD